MLCSTLSFGQTSTESFPYYEIPPYPESYSAGTVAARQIDGLGFRFYWATEGLTEKDLSYRPSDSSRTTFETISHIYNLSKIIANAALEKENGNNDQSQLSYEELRHEVLMNLKMASDALKDSDDLTKNMIIFGERKFPFWHNINGPIADAIWHSGQIAIFRRVTGNPINPNISHFSGTVKK